MRHQIILRHQSITIDDLLTLSYTIIFQTTFYMQFSGWNLRIWSAKLRSSRASYPIRKIACCACAGNAGNVFPATDFKWNLVSDSGMHHGTCVTHVPWWLTRGGGENVSGACATHNLAYLIRGPCSSRPLQRAENDFSRCDMKRIFEMPQ